MHGSHSREGGLAQGRPSGSKDSLPERTGSFLFKDPPVAGAAHALGPLCCLEVLKGMSQQLPGDTDPFHNPITRLGGASRTPVFLAPRESLSSFSNIGFGLGPRCPRPGAPSQLAHLPERSPWPLGFSWVQASPL